MSEDATQQLQTLKAALSSELATAEHVLWSGQPDPRRVLRVTSPVLLFFVPWTMFALGWEVVALLMVRSVFTANESHTPWPIAVAFAVFGLPFVGIGIVMMRKPFVAARQARHMLHAVTAKRVITLCLDGAKRDIKSIALSAISQIEKKDHGSTGSLKLHVGTRRDSDGDTVAVTEDWVGISNATGAEQAIRANQ